MITQLKNVPDNMVAFKATGEVTQEHFQDTVMPAVDKVVERTGELNYMLVVDTELKNFTLGAWWQDMLLGIKKLTKWNRVAIISESAVLNKFTDLFSVIVPGEFKGFTHAEMDEAIKWVSTGEKPATAGA